MSPFDIAWMLLKEDEKFKPEPSRTEEGEKQHPSTTYGMKTSSMWLNIGNVYAV